jgi:hypothetical protein
MAKFSGTRSSLSTSGTIASAHSSHLSRSFSPRSARISQRILWVLGTIWLRCAPDTSTFDVGRSYARFSEAGRFVHGRFSPGKNMLLGNFCPTHWNWKCAGVFVFRQQLHRLCWTNYWNYSHRRIHSLPQGNQYGSSLTPLQYWLVHRTRVDVPSMYRPRGRYRYTYGVVSLCDVAHEFFVQKAFAELARCRCHGGFCATYVSRSHRYRQRRRTNGHWPTLV